MDAAELETLILQRIFDATGFFQRAVFMVCLTFLNECRVKHLTVNCFSHVYIIWFFIMRWLEITNTAPAVMLLPSFVGMVLKECIEIIQG